MPRSRPLHLVRLLAAWCLAAAVAVLPSGFAWSDEAGPDEPSVEHYLRHVKPVLQQRCYACHGALKQEAGLRLDTVSLMHAGGDSGDVIEGGVDESMLWDRVSADESFRMPPEGEPLEAEQLAAIRKWLAAGSPAPAAEEPESAPDEHWAFQPPQASAMEAGEHPVDVLLARRRGDAAVAPPADKRRLVRRLYLDLTGLPPTLAEQEAFLADHRDEAYAELVDRLLESPHYGERWGRHWMDIWRYSDWYGLGKQLRYSQKHLWHWRDWIVESLNEDRGYDEMVRLMLAADELRPDDLESIRATGFLARHYYLFNRTTWLDATLEHTSKAFLGLTINCAKCHDHKYDPLTQQEYYQLRAVFEPYQVRLDPAPGQTDLERDGIPRAFDAHPDAPTYLHVRGDEKQPDKDHPLSPGVPSILGQAWSAAEPVTLPPAAHRPELRAYVRRDRLQAASERIKAARDKVASLEQQLPAAGAGSQDPRTGKLLLDESFDSLDADRWRATGDWKAGDGVVRQTAVGPERRVLQWQGDPPADFVAALKFTVTGGQQWKSVGIAFDGVADREKMIYMSAVQGGSKLQVTYRTPQQVYPDDGRLTREVATGVPYTLTIAMQDSRLNVWIDDEFAMSYQLPVKREPGTLSLIAFDAAVEFDAFQLRAIPAGVTLSTDSQTMSPEAVARALAAARAEAAVAEAEQAAIEAAYRAEWMQLEQSDAEASDAAAETLRAAALAARRAELAKAERALLTAQQTRAAAQDPKKFKQLDQQTEQAQAAVEKAKQRLAQPGDEYTLSPAGLKALEGPAETDASRRAPFPARSTGRRTAFARWVTSPQNPLTARVAVNHIWMRHFGDPLVPSVTDFGRRAPAPEQRELLDHLAVELMEHGWSMKHLHRLIVTSKAYRRSTAAAPDVVAADPDNSLWTRRRPVRMESDIIRDSLLTLAGKLDPTMGGPTIDPSGQVSHRRSLYFTHSRDAKHAFLTMFDHADILRCYRRQESIVPQQALAMANSELSLAMSRAITERLAATHAEEPDFIGAAFRLVLAVEPTESERAAAREMLRKTRELLQSRGAADADTRARQNFVHALVNHNDFVTIR